MNWTVYDSNVVLENNDIIAIDGGDLMGELTPFNSSSNQGTFVHQISVGNNISHTVEVVSGDVIKDGSNDLGSITHYTREGFPSGGVLVRPS